jgi:pterin-4a-carbinolamine dehydratase
VFESERIGRIFQIESDFATSKFMNTWSALDFISNVAQVLYHHIGSELKYLLMLSLMAQMMHNKRSLGQFCNSI